VRCLRHNIGLPDVAEALFTGLRGLCLYWLAVRHPLNRAAKLWLSLAEIAMIDALGLTVSAPRADMS